MCYGVFATLRIARTLIPATEVTEMRQLGYVAPVLRKSRNHCAKRLIQKVLLLTQRSTKHGVCLEQVLDHVHSELDKLDSRKVHHATPQTLASDRSALRRMRP